MESALDVRARPCAELGRGALARVELLEAPGGLESLRLRFARKTMRKPLLVLATVFSVTPCILFQSSNLRLELC